MLRDGRGRVLVARGTGFGRGGRTGRGEIAAPGYLYISSSPPHLFLARRVRKQSPACLSTRLPHLSFGQVSRPSPLGPRTVGARVSRRERMPNAAGLGRGLSPAPPSSHQSGSRPIQPKVPAAASRPAAVLEIAVIRVQIWMSMVAGVGREARGRARGLESRAAGIWRNAPPDVGNSTRTAAWPSLLLQPRVAG